MRSLRDIKKDIAGAPIHVCRQADETVFKHLQREWSECGEDSREWRTQARPRSKRQIACLASAAVIIVTTGWLLYARHASQKRESFQVTAANTSGVALLTEISLERAFRRGGIQAVEDQCREAMSTSAKKSVAPSFEELLAELAGDVGKTGGTGL